MSFGLNFSVAYTISKQIDQTNFANPQDVTLEKVIASWDIPQNLQINFLYELPFGTGKLLGAGLPKPARWAVERLGSEHAHAAAKRHADELPFGRRTTGLNPALPSPSYTEWFNTCTQLAGTPHGTATRASSRPGPSVRPIRCKCGRRGWPASGFRESTTWTSRSSNATA